MQPAELADVNRNVGMSLGAVGFVLPLLAGGNFLVGLRPEDGIAIFDLVAVAVAGMLARSAGPLRSSDSRCSSGWWAVTCLLVLFVWWAGTLLLRPRGPRAVLEAQGIFAAILLFASLSRLPLRSEVFWSFTRGLLLGALVTTLYGQYQYWIAFPRTLPLLTAAGIPAITLVNANFYNANCYAAFLTATMLLAAGLAAAPGDSSRPFAAASLLPLVATLLLSESRSALALLALAAAAWGALRLRTATWHAVRRPLSWGLVAATVLSGVIVATVDLRELWKVGLLGRMAIWQGSLAMIREHWLFGVGLGRFWEHFPSYRVTSYYTRYPHNFLLEVFAELGIVGGAAVVGFLVAAMAAPVRSIARLRSEPARDASWPLLAPTVASVVLIAHALLDIDWHAPANPILLFVLLGFAQHLPLWTKP